VRLALAAALLVSCLVGCGDGFARLPQSATALPTPLTSATPAPVLYTATLSASSSCARQLPAGEVVRVYDVAMSAGGVLQWEAPTITQPRADQRSWLKVDGGTVSLVIGGGNDPIGDVFYGIWEDLGGGRALAIYGQGSGQVEGSVMSGTLKGDFEFLGTDMGGAICHAADHHFTLIPH
jgi:hypothetical protein